MKNDMSTTDKVIHGELIVGNHDSLLFFGNDVQIGLNDFSKCMSKIITKTNHDLEQIIAGIAEQLNKSQDENFMKKNFRLLKSENGYINDIIKKYRSILSTVDQLELSLKLQEAQLIKDTKMLEYVSVNLEESIIQIENYIVQGKDVIEKRESWIDEKNSNYEIEAWYNRLDKKIQDLETSRTVAIQNILQIRLMRENNYLLVDKIVSIIGTTLPIWRNQVSFILGIEKLRYNTDIQEKMVAVALKQMAKDRDVLQKSKKKKVDWDMLQETDRQLIDVLQELQKYEHEDNNIKSSILVTLT